jgi:hypothetical protein
MGLVLKSVGHRKPPSDEFRAQCCVSPVGFISGHLAIEAVPACMCSIVWLIVTSCIVIASRAVHLDDDVIEPLIGGSFLPTTTEPPSLAQTAATVLSPTEQQ